MLKSVHFFDATPKKHRQPMEPDRMQASQPPPALPRRILVVDDDPAIRAFFSDFLEHIGFEVRTAPEGTTALELFRVETFDVVLVDFQMPGRTGLEIAAEIRQKNATIPIALVTGSVQALDASLVAQAGINRVFQKPFSIDELATWLQSLPM
jgi:DNA-binding response OmpR family regulator